MIGRIVIDQIDLNFGMVISITTKQIRQKPRCNRRINTNPDVTML